MLHITTVWNNMIRYSWHNTGVILNCWWLHCRSSRNVTIFSSLADLDRRADQVLWASRAPGARVDAGHPAPEAVRAHLGQGLPLGLRESPRPPRQRHPPARREAPLQQVRHLHRGTELLLPIFSVSGLYCPMLIVQEMKLSDLLVSKVLFFRKTGLPRASWRWWPGWGRWRTSARFSASTGRLNSTSGRGAAMTLSEFS